LAPIGPDRLIAIKARAASHDSIPGMRRTLILALMLVAAPAVVASDAPHLASLQIEIWPEYDRPAALVILKGELAADAGLPAAVAVRIPVSSGGPAAVAYSAQSAGPLLNLPYDRSTAAGFIALRFTVPDRFFHVEFYDPIATGTPERRYQYRWPGDLPAEALHVVLQEPAAASGLSVEPALPERATGTDGLHYRSAQLGPVAQGKALLLDVRYTKTDARTSVELLKADPPAALPLAVEASKRSEEFWLFLASAFIALLLTGTSLLIYIRGRRRRRATAGAVSCVSCSATLSPGDRFCSKCGAART
jgi:hypothetical protein